MAHLRIRSLALPALIAALLTVSACAAKTVSGNGGLSSRPPAVSPTPGSSGHATGTSAATTTDTSTSTATATKTAPRGPRIVSFTIIQQPACPFIPASDAPFTGNPGMDIVLKWSTSGGVTGVALSLDDPNWYKNNHTGSISNYGPSGTAEVPFECDPTDQPNTTHKYTLDTIGGGDYVQQTLTVTKQTSP